LVLGYVLVRRRPKTPAAMAGLIGWVMTVAILLAPATRVGYLLYPVDFFVWAWLLRSEDTVDAVPDALSDAHRPVLVGPPDLDESGGGTGLENPDRPDRPDGSFSGDGAGRDRSRVLTATRARLPSIRIRHGVQP
jgi:hypothetical protein